MAPLLTTTFSNRLFHNFPLAHDGFHDLLRALEDSDEVHITTDGSKIDSGAASAGWLFWTQNYDDDNLEDDDNIADDPVHVDRRCCLMAGTILVDGRLQSNTSYRAEAMGKLTATILLHCLYSFIDRTPTKTTYHTCEPCPCFTHQHHL